MDTLPEIDDPEPRSTRAWKPFGDAPPRPVVGTRAPPAAPRRPPKRRFPLWLPPLVGLLVGGLVALVVTLFGGPDRVDGPRPPAPPPTSAVSTGTPTPAGLSALDAPPTDDEAAVVPGAPGEAPELAGAAPAEEEALAAEAPATRSERPRADRYRRSRGEAIEFDPRRVSDLKANPYEPGADYLWYWEGFRRMSDLKSNPYGD